MNCFDLFPPYTNTLFHSPQAPSEQNIQFHLYSRQNSNQFQQLQPGNLAGMRSSSFDVSKPTKFIVHGFTSSSQTDWVPLMKNELLQKQDANVIVVDWSKGAEGPNYLQATANTRVVGAQIASLIRSAEDLGAYGSDFHVIGHSLGAQIGGYAGYQLDGQLGRITGLDPAAPMFEGYGDRVKLERSDARFVDVIHTDIVPLHEGGLGTKDVIGDADFFPNGGYNMPGCSSDKLSVASLLTGGVTALTDDISCSHNRAPWYFIASINDNNFQAYPCSSSDGVCQLCGSGCSSMGYGAASSERYGVFVTNTGSAYPY